MSRWSAGFLLGSALGGLFSLLFERSARITCLSASSHGRDCKHGEHPCPEPLAWEPPVAKIPELQ